MNFEFLSTGFTTGKVDYQKQGWVSLVWHGYWTVLSNCKDVCLNVFFFFKKKTCSSTPFNLRCKIDVGVMAGVWSVKPTVVCLHREFYPFDVRQYDERFLSTSVFPLRAFNKDCQDPSSLTCVMELPFFKLFEQVQERQDP